MRILCFGDSLTSGWYDDGIQYHPYSIPLQSQLSEHYQSTSVQATDYGCDGECVVGEMERRLPTILKDSMFAPYDYVVLLGGTNDLGSFRLDAEMVQNISRAFKKLYADLEQDPTVKKFVHITVPYNRFDRFPELVQFKEMLNNNIKNGFRSGDDDNSTPASTKCIVLDIGTAESRLNYLTNTENDRETLWSDAIHFSQAGYEVLGSMVADCFKQNIKI